MRWSVPAILIAFAAGLFLLWVRAGDGGEAAASTHAVEPAVEAAPAAAAPAEPTPAEAAPRRPLATTGRLRGRVNLVPGTELPETWTLRVGPSSLFGSSERPEAAESRTLELSGDTFEFDLEGLPFGTYDVRPVAEGMNASTVPVALSADSPIVYVNLTLSVAGTLSGSLEYEGGMPAPHVEVRIRRLNVPIPTEIPDRTTRTDATGRFAFERLPDGEYELHYGEEVNPLLEPKRLVFAAPSMHLPARVLEERGHLSVLVVDAAGNPVPEVHLMGSGTVGGTVDHTTGEDGLVTVAGLPEGDYRIWAVHADFPRTLKLVSITPGEPVRALIELEEN